MDGTADGRTGSGAVSENARPILCAKQFPKLASWLVGTADWCKLENFRTAVVSGIERDGCELCQLGKLGNLETWKLGNLGRARRFPKIGRASFLFWFLGMADWFPKTEKQSALKFLEFPKMAIVSILETAKKFPALPI